MNSRKILTPLLATAFALSLLVQPLLADTFGVFTYTVGTSITITDCSNDAAGVLVIPATIVGKPVTTIGAFAFSQCTALTSVQIPACVTSIGEQAFIECTSLTSITVNSWNPNYSSVDGVLFNKGKTTLVQYPGGKTGSYVIPASVTTIGVSAFFSCSGLTGVTIPSKLTAMEYRAFYGCSSLASITIPANVTTIGDDVFAICSSLTAITVSSMNPAYASMDGVLFNKGKTTLIQWPPGKAGNYVIPGTVTAIGDGAFYNCTGLIGVTIPNSVTVIANRAFRDCSDLTSVTLGNHITTIGELAFFHCSSLTNVTIPASVATIGYGAFSWCSSLTAITVSSLNPAFASTDGVLFNKGKTTLIQCPAGKAGSYVIPGTVTALGDGAFYECIKLTRVTIPNSVTTIGIAPFYHCTGLPRIIIPASVTSIEDSAFFSCLALTSAVFMGNAPSMGTNVFGGAASGFTVYYQPGSTGFTTPTWLGYPCAVGHPEIAVQQPAGTNIADGGGKVFGNTTVGENRSLIFTIKNTGTANLTGLTITKNGTNASNFTITANPVAPVIPDGATTFTVRFAPTAPGAKTAAIHIASNDADENPYDITLTGWGLGVPEIAVQQPAGTNIADGGSKVFANTTVGSNRSLVFTVRNTGTANLTGLAITKNGTNSSNFTITANPAASVVPGAGTTFTVRFAPTGTGTRTATLHIASNDANENPYDITLTGWGLAAAPMIASGFDNILSEPTAVERDVLKTTTVTEVAGGRNYQALVVAKAPGTERQCRIVEVSPNLLDWYSGGNHTTILRNDASILKVRDNTPVTPGVKRYIRLKTTMK